MTVRRFVQDESGMTMGLALMMILLISVMGAGLLTFVSKDLIAVVEVNRVQRAFEVADAGIGAAKRQLASNVVREHYDGDPLVPDIQWSVAEGGLTLNDLDGDATTPDSVNVTIEYKSDTDDFLVISEGTYGTAKRRIEAVFKGVEVPAGGGDGLGHPLYYTPSDIKIEAPLTLSGISMFSEGDILIQGDTTRQLFISDMADRRNGTLRSPASPDELDDWYSPDFTNAPGTWNTVERKQNPSIYGTHVANNDLKQPGLGAEGKICGFAAVTDSIGTCDSTTPSIADGVYGYDCTTGPVDLPDSVCSSPPESRGNGLTFVDKQPQNKDPNDANTITFPFPRPTPIPEKFKEQSQLSTGCSTTRVPLFPGCYYEGIPTPAVWAQLFPNASDSNRVVFIDAQRNPITFDMGSPNEYKGVLVVWCGELVQQQDFKGIVINLYGDGSEFGASSCGPEYGVYTNAGQKSGDSSIKQTGWLYAQGGTSTRAGIILKANSEVSFTRRSWSFLNDAFEGPPPTSFELQGWRELYE